MTSEDLAGRIRRRCVEMTCRAQASHIGAMLSCADVIAVLYTDILRVAPRQPEAPDRDRFILSKGHAAAALYVALAERGFFPPAWLDTYCEDGSALAGHVSHSGVPGVECSTGSLGHGLAMAVGMALELGQKSDAPSRSANARVVALLGDGECQEGSIWEAALFASHHRLSNLTVIVDRNGMQGMGRVEEILDLRPFAAKWRAFGWETREIDGHDHDQIRESLAGPGADRPCCVIAQTIKGKGVSFMENNLLWHYRNPEGETCAAALRELDPQRTPS